MFRVFLGNTRPLPLSPYKHMCADVNKGGSYEAFIPEEQCRRWIAPQVDASPYSDLWQAPTEATLPAHRIPDSQGGSNETARSAPWKTPAVKPIP